MLNYLIYELELKPPGFLDSATATTALAYKFIDMMKSHVSRIVFKLGECFQFSITN